MKGFLVLLFPLIFFSCNKKEEPINRIDYQVFFQAKNDLPTFSVQYSAENNTSKTLGSFTKTNWVSEAVRDKKRGEFVSFTVNTNNVEGTYTMQILLNTVVFLEKKGQINFPSGAKTLSGNIPPQL